MGINKIGSAGPPLDGVEVKIVDEEGKEVPLGEPGELLCVMKGIGRIRSAQSK